MIKNRVFIILHSLLLAMVLLSLLALIFPSSIGRADTIVSFPDPNLEAAIRKAINKPVGDIYQSDINGHLWLDASGQGIVDLTGLEYCTGLYQLELYGNQISDITPLSGLTGLTYLNLGQSYRNGPHGNQITDITPLSGLTNLTHLELESNQIGDLSSLSGLTSLQCLYLSNNQISDLWPLSDLTRVTRLRLPCNQISDITPLSGLTSLHYLELEYNQISGIGPLVSNSGIAYADYVDLKRNPLNSSSLNTWIPQLLGRGVLVYWDAPADVDVVPVLLVHGYKGTTEEFGNMTAWLNADGFDARCVDYTDGQVANGDIEVYAGKLAAEVKETGADKVDIVAHSMGGLIARWYMEKGGGASHVRKLIMLGTPNHGSELFGIERWPLLGPLVSWLDNSGIAGKQMTPGSKLLESLGYGGSSNYYTIAGTDHGLDPNPVIRWFTNLFLKGDDDGLVRTVSVRLSGVADQQEYYLNHKELKGNETLYDNVIKNILLDNPNAAQKYAGLATQQGNNTVQEAPMISDKIFSGEQKSYGIPISATSQVDFALAWGNGNLDLTLTTPSGTTIDPSAAQGNSSISYYQDGNTTIEGYTVQNPEPGIWHVNITAVDVPDEGTDYTVLTFLETTINLSLNLAKYEYDPGEQISIGADLTNDSMPLTGASVTAEIQRPDESIDSLALYDDGLHNDGQANDGVYANTYANTATLGTYDITVSANGTVDSVAFARQAFATVRVEQYPDLTLASSDISFSDDAPIVGGNITIEATIHNMGDANAGNVSVSFYDEAPAYGVLIGEDVIDVNASQTGNAFTLWNPTVGQHEIHVVISPFNGFLEKDYTNNEASRLIDVRSYAQIEVSLKSGWNMVSVPVTPGNGSVSAVFPGVAAVYTWDSVARTYIIPTAIEPNMGYWVAVTQDGNITVTGVPVTTWTSDIIAGWNMTGSVINNASIADPNDNPDNSIQLPAWWWDPVSRTYVMTTDIEPGKGYWVASIDDCTLTMP